MAEGVRVQDPHGMEGASQHLKNLVKLPTGIARRRAICTETATPQRHMIKS